MLRQVVLFIHLSNFSQRNVEKTTYKLDMLIRHIQESTWTFSKIYRRHCCQKCKRTYYIVRYSIFEKFGGIEILQIHDKFCLRFKISTEFCFIFDLFNFIFSNYLLFAYSINYRGLKIKCRWRFSSLR